MEWHTLNEHLQRAEVIEGFHSFIWTERYTDCGDFKIETPSNYNSRKLLQTGVRIGMAGSNRVMTVESVQDESGSDGTKILTVTGRSIEAWLQDRVAMPKLQDLTTLSQWVLKGTPGEVARTIFKTVCVDGGLSPNDVLSFYEPGTFLASGNIPEPASEVTVTVDPDNLYNVIKNICDIWSLGFRFVKDGDNGKIYFEIYTGDDKTSGQNILPAIIFSPSFESIDKTSTLRSIAGFKNVAYVFAKNGTAVVYGNGADSSVTGADRQVLLVKAEDIDLEAGPDLEAAMLQRGTQELAKYRDIYLYDGEIPQHQPYVYHKDYSLGDLVEERSSDGFINQMLVTEQIFVSDAEGDRTYPTLTLSRIVTPGSWEAEPADVHWDDVDLAIHWSDL